MKKIFGIVLGIFLLGIGANMVAFASEEVTEPPIRVIVNDTILEFDQPPVIEDGRTLVPVRAIFQALNATVEWNPDTRTVTSLYDTPYKETIKIELQIDSDIMYVDGIAKTLDVPAKIINSRTLVPVRAISEAFGYDVEWDHVARAVLISTNSEYSIEVSVFLNGVIANITLIDSQDRIHTDLIYENNGEIIEKVFYEYMSDGTIEVSYYEKGTNLSHKEIWGKSGNIIDTEWFN